MHDLDRTFMEAEGEAFELAGEGEGEYEGEHHGETFEFAGEGEAFEFAGEGEAFEFSGEGEGYELGEGELSGEGEAFEFTGEGDSYEVGGEYEQGEVLGEGELNELAAELLSVSNEGELDHFLGSILKKVASAAGSVIKSPVGQQLGGILKGLAKKALPVAGAALGNLIAPGVGGVIGGKLASAAGSAFGLELEGLSSEDREFEIAKQFVRLAADAANRVTGIGDAASAMSIARNAATEAAQRFAPGLLQGGFSSLGHHGHRHHASGRWVRRGNKIILFGV
jgi:hypothetical protein